MNILLSGWRRYIHSLFSYIFVYILFSLHIGTKQSGILDVTLNFAVQTFNVQELIITFTVVGHLVRVKVFEFLMKLRDYIYIVCFLKKAVLFL